MKTNKFKYLWIVQGHYGCSCGWEDVTASDNLKEAIQDLKDHRDNQSYPFRLIQRRILTQQKDK